jgi:hypothetical protein
LLSSWIYAIKRSRAADEEKLVSKVHINCYIMGYYLGEKRKMELNSKGGEEHIKELNKEERGNNWKATGTEKDEHMRQNSMIRKNQKCRKESETNRTEKIKQQEKVRRYSFEGRRGRWRI